jgi:hypothetical protein
VVLHVDHIIASSAGGSDGMENLATSCSTCNLGKSAVPLTRIPTAPAFPTDIAERRKQLKAYMAWQQDVRAFEQEQIALVVAHWEEETGEALRPSQCHSLPFMLKRIGTEQVIYAMDEAARRGRPWKYACGVMYNLLDPMRKFPMWFVACSKECLATHSGIAWACKETQILAQAAVEELHAKVPVVSWDVFRAAKGTRMDDAGEWVLPQSCPAPPVFVATVFPEKKGRKKRG